MGGNCYWYRLAGSLYGYLDWGILVVYYSKQFNCDRLPTLTLHGSYSLLSRWLLALVSSAEVMFTSQWGGALVPCI